MHSIISIFGASLLLGLAPIAGAEVNTDADRATEPAQERDSEAAIEMRRQAFERKTLQRLEPADDGTPATDQVPAEYLENVYADLENRSGGSRADFELLRAEAVRWNDGSLGCPQPGMMYTQMLVDGYRVVLRYQGREYDYRGNGRGFFSLCTGRSAPGKFVLPPKNGAPGGTPLIKQ